MTAKDKLIKLSSERAKTYLFLQRIYREEVDERFLKRLHQYITTEKFMENENTEISMGYHELRKFLQTTEISQTNLYELAADYASLFLGIGKNPAYPYESVYISHEHLVMQEPRNQVLEIYAREGLEKVEDFKEPEDHVAIELEFMAYLCLKLKGSLEKENTDEALMSIEAQSKFFEQHLKSLIPKFCDDIIKGSAKLDFYRAMARITKGFIACEEKNIALFTNQFKNPK